MNESTPPSRSLQSSTPFSWRRLLGLGALVAFVLTSTACGDDARAPAGPRVASESAVDAGSYHSSEGLTWHRDVRPVVEAKCASCHATGGLAPFALITYDDGYRMRHAIADAVERGAMPPWPPSATCNSYAHDRSLSDAERELVVQWARGEAAEGDPASYGAPELSEHTTLRADKTLSMALPYTPKTAPDDYRCFVMDWNEQTTKFVTGVDMRPGNQAIVHHMIAYVVGPSADARLTELEEKDAEPGYTCFGGVGVDGAAWLGSWAPGAGAERYPADSGIEVASGSKVILQMHYNTANTSTGSDLSELRLELADQVAKKGVVLKFFDLLWAKAHTMNIAAGDPDSVQRFEADPSLMLSLITGGQLPALTPFKIYSAGLHMHMRGTRGTLQILRSNGTHDCALEINEWDFHWQGTYHLEQPLTFQPGDKLAIECHFDNSGPRQPVVDGKPLPVGDTNWGETSEDEMCLGLLYVTL